MSRIVIKTKVPKLGNSWLSGEGRWGDYVFSQVSKKVKKSLTEDQENRGHFGDWGDISTIDNFVILKTSLEKAEELTT